MNQLNGQPATRARFPKRRLIRTVLAPIAAAVAFAVAPVGASAHPLDGADPANGCAYQSTETIYAFYSDTGIPDQHPAGWLSLMYSQTCQVAWARLQCKANCNYPANISIIRTSGSVDGYLQYNQTAAPDPSGHTDSYTWTLQVADGPGDSAQACFFTTGECTNAW
jgi:hypothetical protein